ncbi:MAG: serine/threonine protein kinase [Pirellulales bacterium]|nr:serine/threonine protein kinase [Pirellulales bacterium]
MPLEKLGPYRLGRRLGRGGMGTVYAAVEDTSREPAAVKVLSAHLADEEGFRERFEAEIETLRKLRHPNIVRLYGFGQLDDVLYYAMELVEGTSLEEELQGGRRFTWQEAAQIGIQVCRALRHAHDHGVIHRDLKPANLLAARDGTIKLSDFGIAKLFGNVGMTGDGGVVGTAEYMSPEQADSRPITHRADLYALGAVLYALCAGRPPFRARSLVEMLEMQRTAVPEPLRKFAMDVPDEFAEIVETLLLKDPESRPPTALVLGRRLEATARGLLRREGRAPSRETGEPGDRPAPGSKLSVSQGDVPLPPGAKTRHDDSSFAATLAAPGTSRDDPFGVTRGGPTDVAAPAGELPAVLSPDEPTMAPPRAGFRVAPPPPSAMDASCKSAAVDAPQSGGESIGTAATRFTAVAEAEAQQAAAALRHKRFVLAAQALSLAAGLCVLAAGAWYLLRQPTADALYDEISRAAQSDQVDALAAAEPRMQDFLARFSDDARAMVVRGFINQLELDRLERRLARETRRGGPNVASSSIERSYREAVVAADEQPQRAVARLEALLTLYDGAVAGASHESADGETPQAVHDRRLIELAHRQLKRLKPLAEQATAQDLAEIHRQLARAAELQTAEPDMARRIWASLIELYGDRPWAQQALEPARAGLHAATAGSR